jgi:hypothetical protein
MLDPNKAANGASSQCWSIDGSVPRQLHGLWSSAAPSSPRAPPNTFIQARAQQKDLRLKQQQSSSDSRRRKRRRQRGSRGEKGHGAIESNQD